MRVPAIYDYVLEYDLVIRVDDQTMQHDFNYILKPLILQMSISLFTPLSCIMLPRDNTRI